MKKILVTTIAALAAATMLSSPSFADTKVDDEPVFKQVSVNKFAKTNLARAGFKTYRSQSRFEAFDSRYKVRGQGMAEKR